MPDIEYSQQQKISQEQNISPQVVVALEVLKAPSMELSKEITKILAENPMIEEVSKFASDKEISFESGENDNDDESLRGADDLGSDKDSFSEKESNDNELSKIDAPDSEIDTFSTQTYSSELSKKRDFLFDSLVEKKSLLSLIDEQIGQADVSEKEEKILFCLENYIDEKGFLESSVETIAEENHFSQKEIEAGIKLLKSFEPLGIGSRDIQDFYLFQLEQLGKKDSVAYQIVEKDFQRFIARKFSELIKSYQLSDVEFRQVIDELARLKRIPAEDYIEDENREISPDLLFFFNKKKKCWDVVINSEYIPKLRISREYKELMAQGKIQGKDRAYIKNKMQEGRFFIDAIRQRQETLSRIGDAILLRQKEYFEKGPVALRPMTMTEIAPELGVHETTVSRAVANKYAETPWGVIELRKFFSAGVATHSGVDMSNAGVREVLKDVIDKESPLEPLSDEKLVVLLKERGIIVARRTIAKYRGLLKIPPAHLRRKF